MNDMKSIKEFIRKRKKFIKYCIVSVISFSIGLFVYWLFSDTLGISASLIYICWSPLRLVARYLVNKHFVFREIENSKKQ